MGQCLEILTLYLLLLFDYLPDLLSSVTLQEEDASLIWTCENAYNKTFLITSPLCCSNVFHQAHGAYPCTILYNHNNNVWFLLESSSPLQSKIRQVTVITQKVADTFSAKQKVVGTKGSGGRCKRRSAQKAVVVGVKRWLSQKVVSIKGGGGGRRKRWSTQKVVVTKGGQRKRQSA